MRNTRTAYFRWLVNRIDARKHKQYTMLLSALHETEFFWLLDMDANRADDGIALRYRFKIETEKKLPDEFYNSGCTVLEMMVGLAVRFEEQILNDVEYGDRTGQWFFEMIKNLGFEQFTDDRFDIDIFNNTIYQFLNREYDPDGYGSLFVLPDKNVPEMEIWYQAMAYFHQFVFIGGKPRW